MQCTDFCIPSKGTDVLELTHRCAGPTYSALSPPSPSLAPLFAGQRLRSVDMDQSLQPSEYVDALPLLERALAELSKGQLVRDERYGMMDLMSAIEVRPCLSMTE